MAAAGLKATAPADEVTEDAGLKTTTISMIMTAMADATKAMLDKNAAVPHTMITAVAAIMAPAMDLTILDNLAAARCSLLAMVKPVRWYGLPHMTFLGPNADKSVDRRPS